MRPSRQSRTAGFSLVEMLVVIAMIGIMALVAWPKVTTILTRSQVKGARTAIVNLLNRGRILAVQTGQIWVVHQNGNLMWAQRASDGVVAGGVQDLNAQFGVTVTGSTTIAIDPRGLTMVPATRIIRFGRFGQRDSVVVIGYGGIQR